MIENAARRTPARGQRAVAKRHGTHCEKRFVKALGMDMPTEMANKFERHLESKTRTGRLLLALKTQESL